MLAPKGNRPRTKLKNCNIDISGPTDNTQNKKSKRSEESGFIAAIWNERVKDKKEMSPAEPDACLEKEGEMVKNTK